MEVSELFVNGVSVSAIFSCVCLIIVACVPKFRDKFVEFITLRNDNKVLKETIERIEEQNSLLQAKIDDLTNKVKELSRENTELKLILAKITDDEK